MIMGREGLIILENLAKEQHRVYLDSADVGVPYNKESTHRVRCAVMELDGLEYGTPYINPNAGIIKQQAYFIPIEYNDYDRTKTDGIMIQLTLARIEPRHFNNPEMIPHQAKDYYTQPAFYTIEFNRTSIPNNVAWKD